MQIEISDRSQTRIPPRCEEQVVEAYLLMAERARYRPAAPSDGFGHITVPLAELDIDEEAREYAQRFWDQEDDKWWFIGCANFAQRKAMVYLVEAARACCSADPALAANLVDLAKAELAPQRTKRKDW
jgi:hypothetical protein